MYSKGSSMNNNYQSYQTLGGMTHGIGASTAGSTWNGNSWQQQSTSNTATNNTTSSTTSVPTPDTELPKIPPHLEGTININTASAAQLVTLYSEVYAYWNAQVSAGKTSGDTSSTAYQWAVYYADLSSRAAHHYNYIKAQQGAGQYQGQSQPAPATSTAPLIPQGGPPKSFQEYAHRCMKQCVTETQRNSMKAMIELTIRKSLQENSMHSKNWNVEPLLPLYQSITSATSSTVGKSYANALSNSFSNQGNYTRGDVPASNSNTMNDMNVYGHSTQQLQPQLPSSPRGGKRKRDKLESPDKYRAQTLPENNSYYGAPSPTAHSNVTAIAHASPSFSSLSLPKINKTSKKKAKNNPLVASTMPSSFEGDFISLSSLSTVQYTKSKSNKLVRVSSNTKASAKQASNKQKHDAGFDASASRLASRADRFSGQGGIDTTSNKVLSEYSQPADIDRYMGKTVIGGNAYGNGNKLTEEDYEEMTVKGSCQILEKEFLRLTAPPREELVRPQGVLERHLENLLLRRRKNKKKILKDIQKEYDWFCSQLKAMRQDLRVQRIFNSFTVKVYETHARIALEEGDLNEYNQSQTQLQELYDQLSTARGKERKKALENENEFVAYRIIYTVFLTGNKKYQGGSSDLFKIMLLLTSEQRNHPFVAHALKVRVAVADNDYHAFFRLSNECPNHGVYLMDNMIPQMRSVGLKCMMKAYRPSLSVGFLLTELGFTCGGESDQLAKKRGILWLKGCGCVFEPDNNMISAKDTILDEAFLAGTKKSSLI